MSEVINRIESLNHPPTTAMMVLEEVAPLIMKSERRNDVEGFKERVLAPLFDRPEYQEGIDSVIFNDLLIKLSSRGRGWSEEHTFKPENKYLQEDIIIGLGNPAEKSMKKPHISLRAGFAGNSNEFVFYALGPDGEPSFVSVWEPENKRNLFSGREIGTWRKETEGITGMTEGFSSADEALKHLKQKAMLPQSVTWQNLHIPVGFMHHDNPLKLLQ